MSTNENTKPAELKDRMREAMQLRNMRPIDLSEKAGIPKSMVSYYLSGKANPKADRVYAIASVLDVSEAWLMGYDVPISRTQEQKKNDNLVKVIAQLRSDPEFFDVVAQLADLPAGEYASIKQLVSALVKK